MGRTGNITGRSGSERVAHRQLKGIVEFWKALQGDTTRTYRHFVRRSVKWGLPPLNLLNVLELLRRKLLDRGFTRRPPLTWGNYSRTPHGA
ncbi:MAG: hypothetical protein ACOX5Q_03735 [Bacillota bacterium]